MAGKFTCTLDVLKSYRGGEIAYKATAVSRKTDDLFWLDVTERAGLIRHIAGLGANGNMMRYKITEQGVRASISGAEQKK